MEVEIRWTNKRDLCYVASNAREIDKEEILASGPRNMTECGWITWEAMDAFGGIGWTALLDGNPEFVFGFTPQNVLQPHLASAWAWGTDKTMYVMRGVNDWGRTRIVPAIDHMGYTRIEARSLAHHHQAHRWLEWMGFTKDCDLPEWGKDKKLFVQYTWLRSAFVGFGKHGQVEGNSQVRHNGGQHVHGSAFPSAPSSRSINGRG